LSVVLEVQTVSLKQRPRFDALTVQRHGDQLELGTTVRTDAAQATDQLLVMAWGRGADDREQLLYFAKTGPDEDGHIAQPVNLYMKAGRYQRVDIRSIFLGLKDNDSKIDCQGHYVNDADTTTTIEGNLTQRGVDQRRRIACLELNLTDL